MKFLAIFTMLTLVFSCKSSSDNFGKTEEATYRAALSQLASDEFLGRKPFTKGEDLTLAYLEKTFKELGAEPGNGKSYFQDVPMVDISASFTDAKITISSKGKSLNLKHLDDFVGATKRVVDFQKITNAPMVFVGFGINAPEYNWNDYEGLDVKGKVVVVMVNDPGFYNPKLFRGKDMTYYGRWIYKYEEAARQGAEGVIIIHDTAPASYGWGVVRSGWSKSKLYLQSPTDNNESAAIEGWFSENAAKEVFNLAGLNLADLQEKAKRPGFKAVPMHTNLSGEIHNKITRKLSKNFIATLPGTSRKNEYVLFSAHWDHFGTGEEIGGDTIYNGAADNATGVAALITLAKKFKENKPTERSIIFFSPTGEEAGLLGSEFYGKNPVYPLKNTVININFDVLQPFGLMKDVYLIGKGQSEVDDYFEEIAKKENRVVKAVEDPSNGWYYRSDHFNFAKVGVPTLYIANGVESVKNGEEWGRKQREEYNNKRYHKPQDDYSEAWDVSGTMADLKLVYIAGKQLANSSQFLHWNNGISYKKIRESQQ